MAEEIFGYKVLPLRVSQDSLHPHFIYYKEHSVREKTTDKPPGRTLFVLNIPPYVEEEGLKNAFSKAGVIESVLFSKKPTSSLIEKPSSDSYFNESCKNTFKVAYVVFKTVAGLDSALNLKQLELLNSKQSRVQTGLEKWVTEYNDSVPDMKVMKQEIDTYMKSFDEKTKKMKAYEKNLGEADEEGWVTVTKSGKHQGFTRSENMENKIMEKEKLGKKRKELQHFYTFQIRESKMKHIIALRRKFEEDKKKISQLKQTRRFKPF